MRYHRFFEEFILGTPQKQYVQDVHIYICKINSTILPIVGCDVEMQRIYLPSKALKHTYDKRSSTIVECIDYLHPALSSPEKILKNDKETDFLFCKTLDYLENKSLFCPVGVTQYQNKYVLTCSSFFIGKNSYGKNKKRPILWSGEDGASPS
jgi:hypothetical protein